MARNRTGLGWAAVLLVFVLVVVAVSAAFLAGRSSKEDVVSSSPTIEKIQKLGDLVVLRVSIADVVEEAEYEYKGAWVVRGEAEVAVDLQSAQLESANEKTKRLVVLLPQPRVTQARIDHKKSRTFKVTKTTWVPIVGDRDKLTDLGWRKGQAAIEKAASGEEILDQARDQTELVLTNMYGMVGWKVEVDWQGDSSMQGTPEQSSTVSQ